MYGQNKNYSNQSRESRKSHVPHELLKALLYFDLFDYPLTPKEVKRFCGTLTTIEEVENGLESLEKLGHVKHKSGYYSTTDKEIDAIVERRLKGAKKAEQMLKITKRYS